MLNLLYLSYGQGPHVDEAIFSILSARRFAADPARPHRVVIYTDDAAPFAGLGATIHLVSPTQLQEWMGGTDYIHRRKIVALADALRQDPTPTVMVDADTYFRRSPGRLADRIAPGRAVMHVREGQIGHLVALGPHRQRFVGAVVDLPGDRYELQRDTWMWNSGVIGLHPADAPLLDRALAFLDALHAAVPSRITEQVAVSSVLDRHTRLSAARDTVFHYHQDFMRDPFRRALPGVMRDTATLDPPARAAALYPHRPTAPPVKAVRAAWKRLLKPLGFYRYDLETSV